MSLKETAPGSPLYVRVEYVNRWVKGDMTQQELEDVCVTAEMLIKGNADRQQFLGYANSISGLGSQANMNSIIPVRK